MKRILFDTSVYGELLLEPEIAKKIAKLIPKEIIVYGTKIIRRELREISKKAKIKGRSKRILLLQTYDSFVKRNHHDLKITELVELIARSYYKEFKKFGGTISRGKIMDDFRIVGCASLHGMDIVVSHDERSMLSPISIRAYKKVNDDYQLRTPDFLTYENFKRRFIHG